MLRAQPAHGRGSPVPEKKHSHMQKEAEDKGRKPLVRGELALTFFGHNAGELGASGGLGRTRRLGTRALVPCRAPCPTRPFPVLPPHTIHVRFMTA